MATFNKKSTRPLAQSPVKTTGITETFEGASGYTRSVVSDLYLLSVSSLIGTDSFYEKANDRTYRYVDLIREAATTEPGHVTRMMPWLRQDGYMRTGAVLGAAEAAKVLCDIHQYDGIEDMVDGVLQRADEPGEFVAYWFSIAGKAWPKRYMPVRRGLARALTRLINEFSVGKWDSAKRGYRFYKLIEIAHPKPKDDAQADLFKMLIAEGHRRTGIVTGNLTMLQARKQWRTAAANLGSHNESMNRFAANALLDPGNIKAAGLTWEDVLSELGGKIDKKTLWESVIPAMAPGALIRNLRNFDEVGISDEAADKVAKALTDGDRIRKAKVFPYRFLSAYRAAPSLRWGHVLERGLGASLELVPTLKGKTLILVDRSPSMFPNYSGIQKDGVSLADKAALFGASLAIKAEDATLVEFGGDSGLGYWGEERGVGSRRIAVPRGASVLKVVESFGEPINGTDIPRAVKDNFTKEYSRVVIVTDEQSRPGYLPSNMHRNGGMTETGINDLIPAAVPVYIWNMEGYSSSILETGGSNRHCFGGLSDASFSLIQTLEQGRGVKFPWEY